MVIGFIREELWTHVVRGPYERAGHIILVLQNPRDAKVPNFDDVGLGQEDVLCFKVPVKNVPLMQVLQSKITTVTSDVLCTYIEINYVWLHFQWIPGVPWLSGQTTPPPASQVGVRPFAVWVGDKGHHLHRNPSRCTAGSHLLPKTPCMSQCWDVAPGTEAAPPALQNAAPAWRRWLNSAS